MSLIRELIVDAYGCKTDLSDVRAIEKAARKAVEGEGATVVEVSYHEFQPHGLTLCLILKESHFIISTWPEFQMAIVNIFLCNSGMDAGRVWKNFSISLKPTQYKSHEVLHEVGAVNLKNSA